MFIATALVVGANGQQAGIFTLRTGVGLQRNGVIAGGGAEHGLQLVGQLLVTGALLGGGERVQVAELGPGYRDHFAGCIELHGARAERDHGAVQRQVLVGQFSQVAHQLGFRVIAIEHRVAEDRRLAQQGRWQARLDAGRQCGEVRQSLASAREDFPEHFDG